MKSLQILIYEISAHFQSENVLKILLLLYITKQKC